VSRTHLLVCRGPDCTSRGSHAVYTRFATQVHEAGLDGAVVQTQTGCVAPVCGSGPVVCCYPTGAWYVGVTPDDVPEIVGRDLARGEIVERLEATTREATG
jgi:(2Fe-2S) ferredoxin